MQDTENFHVACTFDTNDDSYCNNAMIEKIQAHQMIWPSKLSVVWGESTSKIHAVNRNMPDIDWDIVCVMSDDMILTFYGFDQIIRQAFEDSLDWLVHIPDNDAKNVLATMYIAGRDYYNRFGYIYHPSYKSLFCDNEAQEVAQKLGRYKYIDCPGLIFHANPAYGHQPKDEMFIKQQEIGWTVDQETYNQRKAKDFDL